MRCVTAPVRTVTWASTPLSASGGAARGGLQEEGERVRGEGGLAYREGEEVELACLVSGSYPAPRVQVLLGAKDITTNFSRQASSPSSL